MLDVLSSPQLVHGPRTRLFENSFAASLGPSAHATSVSSCTAGLHLAYMHLNLGPGDEVIVPAQTHVATAHAVEITGAKPVFVDCELGTGNIDVSAIDAAISERTRAISVVHYLGLPADMDGINAIARRKNLFVVEDCALAVGSSLGGTACGLLGDVGSFSFYPVKHMTTGEGGMVVSRHRNVVESIANMKAFGYDRGPAERTVPGVYDIARLGINYRMNEISAAIGLEQLKKVPEFSRRRAANAASLRSAFADIAEIDVLADGDATRIHSNYCVVGILKGRMAPLRNQVVAALSDAGIGTSVYYPVPLPLSTYYSAKYSYDWRGFPNSVAISNNSIAFPVGPHLNEDDMHVIGEALKSAVLKVGS